MKDIKQPHLNRFYSKLGEDGQNKKTGGKLSKKTILEYHRFISSVFEFAVEEGTLADNIARRARPPRPPRTEAEHFEIDELKFIIENLNGVTLKWKVLAHILIASGARRGEILGIKWEAIDFESSIIDFCVNIQYTPERGIYKESLKNRKTRKAQMPDEVILLLKALKHEQEQRIAKLGDNWIDEGFVFTQWNGFVMHPDSVTDWCRKFKKKLQTDMRIHPHKFRHSMAGVLFDQGIDIVTISKRLGHEKVSTTMDIYSHLMAKADEKACQSITNVLYSQEKA